MKIEMCMGSSCHVKGSKAILEMLKKAVADNGFEKKVEIDGSTCLGQCKSGGTNLRIDGEIVAGITRENFTEFFETRVKKALR